MRRLVLWLNAATVLLVIAGLVLLVAPSRLPSGNPTSSAIASAGVAGDGVRPSPAADVNAAERVIRTDIFSSRRSPPTRRYTFGDANDQPDGASTDITVAAPLAGEAVDTSASTAGDAVPHLYGTLLGPNESMALLRLDGRVAEPRLYRIGDRAGGYRVVDIGDRTVTLAGSDGRVVLRLPRPNQ